MWQRVWRMGLCVRALLQHFPNGVLYIFQGQREHFLRSFTCAYVAMVPLAFTLSVETAAGSVLSNPLAFLRRE